MRTREICFRNPNVCGGMDDKIDDVCELMKERRLNILCVNGTKRKGNGGAIKHRSRRRCRGVNFIISERLSECINGYESVNLRLLSLQVKTELMLIFILGVYTPDMFKPFEEREEFWVDVRDILRKCDRNERIVMLADFSA
ncbi:hypothetical protein EVAR_12948_1 [Eumeta japonica]|uniref:Uncharacterized protein n=1 Tax=Eumeta variegata TaxID=151549 RepID=A0A4C1TVU1_EUMVA|nr:hypothetical protein EVAR_12948_1 [Eumeta japonica]